MKIYFDTGVMVTLSSDDPAMFSTSLAREYQLAQDVFGDALTIDICGTRRRRAHQFAQVRIAYRDNQRQVARNQPPGVRQQFRRGIAVDEVCKNHYKRAAVAVGAEKVEA